ncbi:MAG TPA: PD-(D/E)XK nuclease family protein [Acidimicrobiia bacterium]|nr:PD-(D/E)XK nuclease family protein [Acidimicrobiia bacterium]
MVVSIPHVIQGDPVRLSASTYVAWKKCPDSANARLQGIYGPGSRPAFVGTLAHRIFARHLSGGPIASEEFVQACREEIGASGLNNQMADLSLKPSALASVIEEVRSLYERFTRLPGEGFEGSEVVMDISNDEGVQLVGTIDAVYREDLGGHRLVDWKTGEIGDAEDQLMFYSLLWALDRDEVPAYVEAVSVKTGERHRTVPSTADVIRVADDVARLVDEMRAAWRDHTALDRHGGPWCKYCPLLEDCPEGQSAEALLG